MEVARFILENTQRCYLLRQPPVEVNPTPIQIEDMIADKSATILKDLNINTFTDNKNGKDLHLLKMTKTLCD
jgi:hypothetical protein